MRNAKGFTLIEVILTIIILAIVIPTLIAGVSFMSQGQVNPLGTTTAVNLAREKLEAIIADKRNPAITFASLTNARYPAEVPVAGYANYNRSVDITCVDPEANPYDVETAVACPTDYRKVEVTVQSSGVGPNVPDVVLVTLLANY